MKTWKESTKTEIRLWCLQHRSRYLNTLRLYDWLLESEDSNELELRKQCVLYEPIGQFRNLDETLNWLKSGELPNWTKAQT